MSLTAPTPPPCEALTTRESAGEIIQEYLCAGVVESTYRDVR